MEKIIIDKVDEIKDQIINDIVEITKINSVQSAPKDGMPYGEGIHNALLKSMDISQRLGFRTRIVQDCVGVAELGQSDDYIGMVGHLDVVPTGEGWKNDPFSCAIEDNKIYARGILDNKGPILSCLYAAYILKECGYEFPKSVRVLFGTNEETGMEDMKTYLKHEKPPVFGWTPDCKYPVVYAERGRLKLLLEATNIKQYNEFLNVFVLMKQNIENLLGIEFSDDEFGKLQIRTIQCAENDLSLEMVISYPASISIEKIQKTIVEKCNNFTVSVLSDLKPVFFDIHSNYVKILSKSYEDITGRDGTPVTTTGGTYAKVMPNILPFGPSFPEQKGIGHLPNEWMDIDDIIINVKIYALSLYRCLKEFENDAN